MMAALTSMYGTKALEETPTVVGDEYCIACHSWAAITHEVKHRKALRKPQAKNSLIDGKGVQKILRDVDQSDLAVALKGASLELRQHVRASMSQRAAGALEDEMEIMGPVKLRDVEAAQRRILESARELEQGGELVVQREGDTDEFVR